MEDFEETGVRLQMGDDGVFRIKEDPYTSIEIETEEDYKKLNQMLSIASRIEYLINNGHVFVSSKDGLTISSLEDILNLKISETEA